jgi:phosphatidylserine decarboxylase
MVRDGIYYACALGAGGALTATLAGPRWSVPLWLLAGFLLYFFRDPGRTLPAEEGLVSPADGRLVELRQVEMDGQRVWKLSIFLSIFDVHVNRAPLTGVIRSQQYKPGRFLVASRPEASVENEQNMVTIEGEDYTVTLRQIAGAVARRSVFYTKVGARGGRGARLDLFFPLALEPRVAVGDRVKAGASLLAQFRSTRAGATAAPARDRGRAEEVVVNSERTFR